jgi:hypothetical protein
MKPEARPRKYICLAFIFLTQFFAEKWSNCLTQPNLNWTELAKPYLLGQTWPNLTKIHQNSPKFTKIHQNSPKFTKIHQNSPKFTKIHQNSPKLTKIDQANWSNIHLEFRSSRKAFRGSGLSSKKVNKITPILIRFNEGLNNAHVSNLFGTQGCQMVCFHTENPNLGKFWRALD